MKRVGLLIVFLFSLCCLLTAYPQPMGRQSGSKTAPLKISAMTFIGTNLYTADEVRSEVLIYDLLQGTWQASGVKYSSKSRIVDLVVVDSLVYLLDAKANTISIYQHSGELHAQIKTRGAKELAFNKAKRILVNYQGFIYVMDSMKLYALSKEGMLMATANLDNPVSMSLGEDQIIRVLQHGKNSSEIVSFDLNLVRKSRLAVSNIEKRPNFIIDMAVNAWGDIHVLNSAPISVSKLNSAGQAIPDTRFGSLNRSSAPGNFEAPAILKCSKHESTSLIAIYDTKQQAIHFFQDTEHSSSLTIQRPPYTVRPSLEQTSEPVATDFLADGNAIYRIVKAQMSNSKAKPGPAVVCQNRDGTTQFVIHLASLKDKKVQEFTALAVAGAKLYVLDSKASKVHVFDLATGAYQKSFAQKGNQDGRLSNPKSIVAASDGLLYIADTGNRRIAVFNQYETFVRNIPLLKQIQRPVLLRTSGEELFCLSSDNAIMRMNLKDGKKMSHVLELKEGISSFDLIMDGRMAVLEKAGQKLRIYKGNVREYTYFTKNSTAEFPHFAAVFLIRYDAAKQRLAIMDTKAKNSRYLNFYAALDGAQSIRLALTDDLKVMLSWDESPGIHNWIVKSTGREQTQVHRVNAARYEVQDPPAELLSYQICPVADDGKEGMMSEGVQDHFSYARYLYGIGRYLDAAEAFRESQADIRDARIDPEIVQCHIAEADRLTENQDYERALSELRAASSILGTSETIALKAVNIYKLTLNYLGGVRYLQGVGYQTAQSLFKQFISLHYLANDYSGVINEADHYQRKYGRDEEISRYLAASYEARGDYEDALSEYQEIVSISPGFEDDLKIGELQYQLAQYRAADSHLQLMLTKYPSASLDRVRALLGKCNMQSKNYGIAMDHYRAAILINNNIADYHHGLGMANLYDNHPYEAELSLRRAYTLSPDNALIGLNFAKALERQGKIDAALEVMDAVTTHVAGNQTAVEFHVLYSGLLHQVGRLEEAYAQITKAQTYSPDDFTITQKLADIRAELQVKELSREVIEIRSLSLDPIYPSLNQYYRLNPIGTITLYNTRNMSVTNLLLSVYVHEVGARVMEFPISSLIPKQEKVVDITMEFNDRLFDRARRVPIEVTLRYEFEGNSYQPSLSSQTLEILDNKAMNWQYRRSLASFVNPTDEALRYFVRQNIVQTFSTESSQIINPNLIRALQAYSFYRANGVSFSNDTSVSNLDAAKLDEVQYPHQTLASKTGDCEDLLVLMAGTLESLGTPTAFIDIPGHVMLAVNSGMAEAQIRQNGLEPEYFIESQGAWWFPLETTLIGKADFVTSWLTAIRHYREVIDSGSMPEIVVFGDAHHIYPPSNYTKAIDPSGLQKLAEARSLYQQDLARMVNMSQINIELGFIAALEKYPANNTVRMRYALYCIEINKLDQAERLLKDILNRDPQSFDAMINLGNLYAQNGQIVQAEKQYQAALPFAAGKEDQVYRNLCLLTYKNLDRASASKYFNLINRKEIIREVDSQIYADLMNTGD